jgi:formyl-CoA transferase
MGLYMMGWDAMLSLRMGVPTIGYDRFHAVNPIINCYQSGDGKWFWLLLLQADRHWGDLCSATGREDLMTDERFANIEVRRNNAPALVEEFDKTFGAKIMSEWAEAFKQYNVWWAPVNYIHEAINDPMVRGAGAFVDVPSENGNSIEMVATPADFSGTSWAPRGMPPELGQHTEEVLLELGYDWEHIVALKERGAIP